VCVVGAGTRFLSGISYYTLRLTNALASTHSTSAVLMRQLLPTWCYPGRQRVGADLTRLRYDASVRVFDGVDWYWLPSIGGAVAALVRERPEVLVLQWWTGTVLHSYLAMAVVARLLGARTVVEFHEVQDSGEARLPLASLYVRLLAPLLMRLADGFVVHSEFDRAILSRTYWTGRRPVAVIPHGPYDHYDSIAPTAPIGPADHAGRVTSPDAAAPASAPAVERAAPAGSTNLLYFGVIRPYKGLEDLITAFDRIPKDQIGNFWLTVVGETWEGWTLPAEMIARSRYRDRITFVNAYVPDEQVAAYFAAADVVVLPYHRSSASGPLHVAMSHGLPVVVTSVGGLREIAEAYAGATLIPPHDPAAIGAAIQQAAAQRGTRHTDPFSWDRTVEQYGALFSRVLAGRPRGASGRTQRPVRMAPHAADHLDEWTAATQQPRERHLHA
jgi:glycosyltransferase involved in cell wall biosynthesis